MTAILLSSQSRKHLCRVGRRIAKLRVHIATAAQHCNETALRIRRHVQYFPTTIAVGFFIRNGAGSIFRLLILEPRPHLRRHHIYLPLPLQERALPFRQLAVA